jgi:poly(3-hydroxybutyrate) depolymerase
MMAAEAACEMPNVVAAAVTVSGPLLAPSQDCSPILALHGTADATVPVDGGYSKVTRTYLPSDRFIAATQRAAGNVYDLVLLNGAGHAWPTRLNGQPASEAIATWLTQHGATGRISR